MDEPLFFMCLILLKEKMSDSFEIKGKIAEISDIKQVNETFKVREFVLVHDEKYPEELKMQVKQDLCEVLNSYNHGEAVHCHFNIQGSKSERDGRVFRFNNLNVWKIQKADDLPF